MRFGPFRTSCVVIFCSIFIASSLATAAGDYDLNWLYEKKLADRVENRRVTINNCASDGKVERSIGKQLEQDRALNIVEGGTLSSGGILDLGSLQINLQAEIESKYEIKLADSLSTDDLTKVYVEPRKHVVYTVQDVEEWYEGKVRVEWRKWYGVEAQPRIIKYQYRKNAFTRLIDSRRDYCELNKTVDFVPITVQMERTRGDKEFKGGTKRGGPCVIVIASVAATNDCVYVQLDAKLYECGGPGGGEYKPRSDHTTLEGATGWQCAYNLLTTQQFLTFSSHQHIMRRNILEERQMTKDYHTGSYNIENFAPGDLINSVSFGGDQTGDDIQANRKVIVSLNPITILINEK